MRSWPRPDDDKAVLLKSPANFLMLCRLSSAAYGAIACFAIEYIALFMGVSLFMRGHSCLYIMLHFVGAVVTGLLYTQVRALYVSQ